MVAKDDKAETLKDNPAEFTTCADCHTRRKLPDRCKCEGRAV